MWLKIFEKKSQNLETVIKNNFNSHKRNIKKIALIYTLQFTFLILVGIGLKLEKLIIQNAMINNVGSDLTAEKQKSVSLDEYGISSYLNKYMQIFPDRIYNYTYISSPIDQVQSKIYF